jgi:hypothetical protein
MSDEQLPNCKRTLRLGAEEIVLDSNKLKFNETNVNQFMENLALYYDYFGQKLAEAESLLSLRENEAEVAYAFAFEQAKGEGGTEKLADAKAKQIPTVVAANQAVVQAKCRVTQLKQHLKSWDKAHDNLQSRGHMLRKEMDKLHLDIRSGFDNDVERIVRGGS